MGAGYSERGKDSKGTVSFAVSVVMVAKETRVVWVCFVITKNGINLIVIG